MSKTTASTTVLNPAARIADVDASVANYTPSGVGELDRVLGGGLVPGAVVLVAGEPGVGKSTLLLDVAAHTARGGKTVLYVTGEESAAQVKLRADRINAVADNLFLCAENDLGTALGQVEAIKPALLIVDSVQTLASAEVDGAAGGVTQVREVAASIIAAAKRNNMTTLLVGHVTKDGSIAGPRVLEHLVDVVCQFEGERHSRLRLLRAAKNRYGTTDEVGCFDLTEDGISGLSDPSSLFLSRTKEPVSGTCVSVTFQGRRPILAEVQALVAKSSMAQPHRATHGLDSSRVAMLLAVLARHGKVNVGDQDCYVATVGGVKLTEPAVDLATAIAVASAVAEKPVHSQFIAFGEVGLAGEVRQVPDMQLRIAEAARLGFTHALVPASPHPIKNVPAGFTVRSVDHLSEALRIMMF